MGYSNRKKIALVYSTIPSIEEINQFFLLKDIYDVQVISSESICKYIEKNTTFDGLTCVVLPDHDENSSFLPGLEKVLANYDLVVIKERLGLYAYQAVKAKWQHKFRLVVWIDNLLGYPADDIDQLRTIRTEVTNAADFFIVQSKAAKNALLLEDIDEKRIKEFTPFVNQRFIKDPAEKSKARKKLGLEDSHFMISHVGEIEWEEGLLELVSAIKHVFLVSPSLKDKIKLVICGIGSLGEVLRAQIMKLGIDSSVIYATPDRITYETVLKATDIAYVARCSSRDRVSGEPYQILSAMSHGLPILSHRSAIVEELCGKHRIDFCSGSIGGLSSAITKSIKAETLIKDIVKKNENRVKDQYHTEKVKQQMTNLFNFIGENEMRFTETSLDVRVFEAESKVKNKQYLDAIDIIESIFKVKNIPIYHKANLYRLIGDCFAKLGDTEAAKDSYIKACDLDPYSAKVYVGLGTVGLIKNSYDISVLHFQKAISLSPKDEMANLGLGLSFQGMKELKEASKWIWNALEINPENTAAIYSLVKIAYENEIYTKAIEAVNNYLSLHPNDYNMLYTLGGLLYRKRQYQDVIDTMNLILEIDPLDKRALALLKSSTEVLEKETKVSSQ